MIMGIKQAKEGRVFAYKASPVVNYATTHPGNIRWRVAQMTK